MEGGEMSAVMWLPVTCRFPVYLNMRLWSWHVCTPDSLLAWLQWPPFNLDSAPSSCICRQLYLDAGTNTFLPEYELQLTEEAYRLQHTLTSKSLLNSILVYSHRTLHNTSKAPLRLWIRNCSAQLVSLICDVWLLLITFPELLPAQRTHNYAFWGDLTFLRSNKHDLLCRGTSFKRF